MDETPTKTSRVTRINSDLEKSSSVLAQVDPSIGPTSIRDQFRLGKFNRTSARPRPILVKLTRTAEVASLLSKRETLQSPLCIKPDKPLHERRRDATLLKERWRLLQLGEDKKNIRIIGDKIMLNKIIHATYCDGGPHFSNS